MEEDDYPVATPPPRRVLARSANKEEILDYSLMLASQGLKHWTEFDGEAYTLTLEEKDVRLAEQLMELYRSENRDFHEEPPALRPLDLLLSPLLWLAVPASLYFWVEMQPAANWWYNRGRADAAAILDGEWWRCLTATTLHADHEHFLGNLLSGYFIFNLLNHRLGIGTLMLATALGAALTNWLVALASPAGHLSIGFSTVVFCSLGVLAALETMKLPGRRAGSFWKGLRNLAPLIAAFFLAVFVGLGENADVKAHFYGFGVGAALGFLCRRLPRAVAKPAAQGGMVLGVYGLYAVAWALALR